MRWWHRLWRRTKMEEELEKELRFHLEPHAADLISQGVNPVEARRKARLALGGLEQVKEMRRDARGTRWLEDLLLDLRSVSYPNFVDWRAQNGVFEQIAIYRESTMTLTGGSEPTNLRAVITTPDLFPLLNVRPQLGRGFLPEEAISSERDSPDDKALNEERGAHVYDAIARLKPGLTLATAQTDLETVMGRLRMQYPDEVGGDHTAMRPYLNDLVGDVERALLVLFGAVGMVLLIACANVASLLLARGVTRHSELAVRTALGASWQRIIRQLLTESLLLASLGGLAALLPAMWGVALLKTLSPETLPRVQDVQIDDRVLIFTLLASLLTGLIFGLIPALRAARTDLNEMLNEGGRSGEGLRRNHLRSALVVAEVALALVLLVGAGLLINSFARLRRVNPGFDPHQVLTCL